MFFVCVSANISKENERMQKIKNYLNDEIKIKSIYLKFTWGSDLSSPSSSSSPKDAPRLSACHNRWMPHSQKTQRDEGTHLFTDSPPGPWFRISPQKCRQRLRPQPGQPSWLSSRSIRPSSPRWRRGAWSRRPTVWSCRRSVRRTTNMGCVGCHGMCTHVHVCAAPCEGSHWGDSVEGRVSADAEVRAGDVVRDGGRDDHNGNTHLLIFLSGLDQLKASNVSLQPAERETPRAVRFWYSLC